ncbi:hypothetical protein BGW36DRAFT_101330 [Talaromyces proteolyticus]|uniref:Zn(2)-C6 fungal-type domain-containing protein n=1 Tax=Talaromyces proteolyticus TaxID=1131652 RepID=A0AAD4Q0U6_9EURO|nr:uncharacterized protein BGW36DRAFT_101330 [Talaromyces proteolyticus]KAH8701569.1 hypothetical protein BGW36DRAFT_101330 [Talaromyces proteolyticus]
MSRRPHKKSRNGCRECKARHMKCDETRPTCLNCSTSHRVCSYPDRFINSRNVTPAPTSPYSVERPAAQCSSERNVILFPLFPVDEKQDDTINMAHLELFNHLVNGNWESFGISRDTYVSMATRDANKAPYLMYELLSMSAQHLGATFPGRSEYYGNQAIRLQNKAIALFNTAVGREDVTSENCVPYFVFSSMLGAHHFCNVLRCPETDFKALIVSLVDSLNLYQGLRTISRSKWHIVADSEIKPVVESGRAALRYLDEENYQTKEVESKRLIQLLDEPVDPLESAAVNADRHAINVLDSLLRYYREDQGNNNNLKGVFGWPALVKDEFKHELIRLSPKALIILAHYAVLLYYQRELWLLGDSGRLLVESIHRNIDIYWMQWLEWPMMEISSETIMGKTS